MDNVAPDLTVRPCQWFQTNGAHAIERQPWLSKLLLLKDLAYSIQSCWHRRAGAGGQLARQCLQPGHGIIAVVTAMPTGSSRPFWKQAIKALVSALRSVNRNLAVVKALARNCRIDGVHRMRNSVMAKDAVCQPSANSASVWPNRR